MKIRTVEQLFDFTSEELAWRKKELQSLRSLVKDRPRLSPANRNVLLRSLITLTYAHWEGFIRSCAGAYLEYVAMQRLRHDELAPNFLALALRPLLNSASQSKGSEEHIKLVRFFMDEMQKQSSIPFRDIINTESNLSSNVFRNLITMLDFDYSFYETKEKLIDEKLLKARNYIAHGEYMLADLQEALEIHEQCIELMEVFNNQVHQAASSQHFRSRTESGSGL